MLRICDFGSSLVPYGEGLNLQQRLAELCKEQAIPDTLLLLQAGAGPPAWLRACRSDCLLLPAV